MDLDTVRNAILSLTTPVEGFPDGFPGTIGVMGGEPTAHPQFAEICKLFQELIPNRRKRELWTDGYRWEQYREIIEETFDSDNVTYNSHEDEETGWHQPLLVGADELVEDKELMWQLIGNCWVQWRWSCSITPKGGFFCEVAAAQDQMFDGPGGYAIEPGWWNKDPNEFADQVERYCTRCSAAIPMEPVSAHADYDLVSRGNLQRLLEADSPRAKRGNVKLFEGKLTKDQIMSMVRQGWTPWNHRPYKMSGPERFVE